MLALIIPRWLAECFHGYPCPGVFVCILGFLAAAVAFKKEPSTREKGAWLVTFFVLLVLEIISVNVEHAHQSDDRGTQALTEERHFEALMNRKELQITLPIAQEKSERRVSSLKSDPPQPNALGNIKTRAILLSQDILQFLADRQAREPSRSNSVFTREQWEIDNDRTARYFMETMNMYSVRFAAQVIVTHDELAAHHYRDQELDDYYENPTNPIGIRIVAEHLGALAEQIKQP